MDNREPAPTTSLERPTGVTILAVLAAIGGALGLLGSMTLLGLGGLAVAFGGGLVMLFGLVALATSIGSLAFAYGAWQLRPWAWTLGVATFGASAALTLLQLVLSYTNVTGAVVSLAIAGAVLYYLNQPVIKAAFGR